MHVHALTLRTLLNTRRWGSSVQAGRQLESRPHERSCQTVHGSSNLQYLLRLHKTNLTIATICLQPQQPHFWWYRKHADR